MIIKNNFNNKNANPLKDYKSIGKTRDNVFDSENTLIKENLNNKVIEDIIKSDHEYDDSSEEVKDKWDFFK